MLLLPLVLFLLTSCADKPWTDPLDSSETDAVGSIVDAMVARDGSCSRSLAGDLSLFYKSPLDTKALNGFLQFSGPSSYKFVLTNPFGQPLLAIAGDQKSFQAINTLGRKYISGSVRSFGIRNNIPDYFLEGDWEEWLTARNRFSSQEITDVRRDRKNRGLWVTFRTGSGQRTGAQHLLLNLEDELLLGRILENEKEKIVAEISYDNWINQGSCKQPLEINITGLYYGANIRLRLSDVTFAEEVTTYQLPTPPGYIRQFMP